MFEHFYSEKTIRLPDTFFCYSPIVEAPPVSDLPAAKAGYITFGCLNNFCKINPGLIQLWGRVLRAVPNSRMLLLSPRGRHRQWVYDNFATAGIAPDRVEMVHGRPRPDYLALYSQIDISLDPLPYNGHTTSLDSLWMGVPLVTLPGNTVVGRAGLSQLTNLGLTELIASDPDDYVELARQLAGDLPRLAALRTSMRQRMTDSPLMDAKRFAHHVESAYRWMWEQYCKQEGADLPG
jgi:predicted O-linked N-acetylglucosamine transferase (SPINDLY family)